MKSKMITRMTEDAKVRKAKQGRKASRQGRVPAQLLEKKSPRALRITLTARQSTPLATTRRRTKWIFLVRTLSQLKRINNRRKPGKTSDMMKTRTLTRTKTWLMQILTRRRERKERLLVAKKTST